MKIYQEVDHRLRAAALWRSLLRWCEKENYSLQNVPWSSPFFHWDSLFEPVFTSSSHLSQPQAALRRSDSGHLWWSLAGAMETERLAGDTSPSPQSRLGRHDNGDNNFVGNIY